MVKRILKLSAIAFCSVVVMSGCMSVQPKAQSYSYSEYRTVDPSQVVNTAPIVADLVVSEKRITYAERLGRKVNTMTNDEVAAFADREKQVVVANAIKQNNADVLVAPIIDIQTDANGYLVITITGYPASYKNFRNAKPDEAWFIKTIAPEGKEKAAEKEQKTFPQLPGIKK